MKKRHLDISKVDKGLIVFNHYKEIEKYLKPYMTKQYYDGRELLQHNSEYLMAFGEKSNGKSTFFQMVLCICWWLYGYQSVLLRLYDEDFKKGRAEKMFGGLPQYPNKNPKGKSFIANLTNDKYDTVVYTNYKYYFAKYDDKKGQYNMAEKPFCFRQCILNAGSSFQMPDVQLIFFDEFIRKDTMRNVPDEFVEFQTVISTIKRSKTTLQVFMAGNTVNYYSCYFTEFGISKMVKAQKQGTILDVSINDRGGTLSVEYCDTPEEKDKASDKYFVDSTKVNMIMNGAWQLDNYPHLPCKYKLKDIILTFFIKFDNTMFKCDFVCVDKKSKESEFHDVTGKEIKVSNTTMMFVYIQYPDEYTKIDYNSDIIYQLEYDSRPNVNRYINVITYEWQRPIFEMFKTNKIFYQNNEIGDTIRAYLKQCYNK